MRVPLAAFLAAFPVLSLAGAAAGIFHDPGADASAAPDGGDGALGALTAAGAGAADLPPFVLDARSGTGAEWSLQVDDAEAAAAVLEAAGHPVTATAPGVVFIRAEDPARAAAAVHARDVQAAPRVRAANDLALAGAGISWSSPEGAGRHVTVAVLDTGVRGDHACLLGQTLAGYDALHRQVRDPADGHGHGTHVACTAIGHGGRPAYPYGPLAGAAPEARLVDVRVLGADGSGSVSDLVAGLRWVQAQRHTDWGEPGYEGIDIVVLSLSLDQPSDGTDPVSAVVNSLVADGIVVVAAAGNHVSGQGFIAAPAAADGAIAVGALDVRGTADPADDVSAAFSNQGPRLSDGDDDRLDEQKPDLIASGVKVRSAGIGHPEQYVTRSGTSMATPVVAGAAAVLLGHHPGLSPDAVRRTLRDTARDMGPAGWDPVHGAGALDVQAALGVAWKAEAAIVVEPARPVAGEHVRVRVVGAPADAAVTWRIDGKAASDAFAVPAEGVLVEAFVDAGVPVRLGLRLEPAGAGQVQGTVSYGRLPVAADAILFEGQDGEQRRVQVGADGTFAAVLPAGRWRAVALEGEGLHLQRPSMLTVREDREVHLRVAAAFDGTGAVLLLPARTAGFDAVNLTIQLADGAEVACSLGPRSPLSCDRPLLGGALVPLPPGRHRISGSGDGVAVAEALLTIGPQPRTVFLRPQASHGDVTFSSAAAGLRVEVRDADGAVVASCIQVEDGVDCGGQPFARLPAGRYTAHASAPTFRDQDRALFVRGGSASHLALRLQTDLGSIEWAQRAAEAVWIAPAEGGANTSLQPGAPVQVPSGRYVVYVEGPDQVEERPLVVRPGSRLRLAV